MSLQKITYKLGQMVIDNKQIFWKMKYCYALIPIVQLFDGHILIATNRKVEEYSQLQPVQVFDLTLTTRFISRAMQSFYNCTSSTIHIQNSLVDGPIRQMMVHIIPRKVNDLKNNDTLYDMLAKYPQDLSTHYNEKMNFYINAYANKILQGISQQSKKYEAHLNICFKQQKQT